MFNISSVDPHFQSNPYPVIYINQKENLGTIGVFASSLILSLGGFFSVVFASCRQSRCRDIKLFGGCVECDRDTLKSPEVITTV